MSNAASARDQLQSHLHSEAALRAILLTAKLLSDSFEQNTPSASASRQALALKQDAIAAVNNALTRNINRAEFDSMSYALYLLMLIEVSSPTLVSYRLCTDKTSRVPTRTLPPCYYTCEACFNGQRRLAEYYLFPSMSL